MRPMWASDASGIWWCSELCLPILKLRFDLEIEPQGTLWLGGSRQCWERWIFLEALSPNFHRNARQSRNLQVSNRKTSPNRLHGRIHYWIHVSSSTFSGPKNLFWANIKMTSRLSVFFSRVPKRLLRRMFWHPTSNIRCEFTNKFLNQTFINFLCPWSCFDMFSHLLPAAMLFFWGRIELHSLWRWRSHMSASGKEISDLLVDAFSWVSQVQSGFWYSEMVCFTGLTSSIIVWFSHPDQI